MRLVKLSRQYACCATPGCHEAIFSDGGQWRHERNLSYRCPSGAGWADSFDPDEAQRQLEDQEERHAEAVEQECQIAAEAAEEVGRKSGFDEGKDEGIEQGRKAMHAEIDEALSSVDFAGLSLTDDQRAGVFEALASAWNSCAP